MGENIEVKDVQKTEYLDKNGLDMLWAKVKENTRNQVEVESNRAVTQETRIIETKADKSVLDNYVLNSALTALEQKVTANTTAIEGKQDAGNYITFEERGLNEDYAYIIKPSYYIKCKTPEFDNGKYNYSVMSGQDIGVISASGQRADISSEGITIKDSDDYPNSYSLSLGNSNIISYSNSPSHSLLFSLNEYGVKLDGGSNNRVLTSNGSTIDITEYAKKSEITAGGNVDDVQVNGVSVVENKIANIKPATKESLGVVKVGDGLNVTDGAISVDISSILIDILSYGVEWDTTVSDPACTRIGNMSYHKSLPIQSEYKGCLVKNGKVNYYLDPNDWSKKADGTPSVLDGTDGDVMVHIPKFYGKSGSNGNKRWVRIATTKIDSSWVEIPEMFVSAYRITTFDDSGTSKIASVVNTTANYRGGDNNADYDQYLASDKFRTNLGKPRTNVSRATMRTNASNSGQELLCYEFYKWVFYWAYVIEYANFNSQKEFNSELTSNGYHQGGLGSGLTTIENYTDLKNYNSTNPITPCGYTNEFGNFSGTKSIPANQSGLPVTVTANRWRGFENPFGDIETILDGIIINRDDHDPESKVYTTSDSSKFGEDISLMNFVGTTFTDRYFENYIREFDLGETGEIIPNKVNATTSTYKCDEYTGQNGYGATILFVGGNALDQGSAGLCRLNVNEWEGYESPLVGFRSVIRT